MLSSITNNHVALHVALISILLLFALHRNITPPLKGGVCYVALQNNHVALHVALGKM